MQIQDVLEFKEAYCRSRTFPMQFHQWAKSAQSAKLPILISFMIRNAPNLCNIVYFDCKHHLKQFGPGGALKPGEEKGHLVSK